MGVTARGLLLLLALTSVTSVAQAQSPKEARVELDKLKQDLDAQRDALRDLDNKERSLLQTLGELDRSLSTLNEQLAAAKAREDERKLAVEQASARVQAAEERQASVRARLRRRLRALYVLGEGGAVRALIGAQSFEDLSYRRRLVEQLAHNDAALVREHARVTAEVEKARETHAARLRDAELERVLVQERTELARVTREERGKAIARIDGEKELRVRVVKEIVERQRALGGLLHEVSKRSGTRPRRGRGVLREGLSWPVRGEVIRRFGTIRERDTGARLTSNGVEIRAGLGAPIGAAADGIIAHVGWLRGFGRIVIVDHGEGHHTLNAHLSSATVARGDEVRKGDTIGLVGDTESINGPKLYFELRARGRPKDPIPYMR
jgi:septal ring factor EnvC (AmiA/AmiB activator)